MNTNKSASSKARLCQRVSQGLCPTQPSALLRCSACGFPLCRTLPAPLPSSYSPPPSFWLPMWSAELFLVSGSKPPPPGDLSLSPARGSHPRPWDMQPWTPPSLMPALFWCLLTITELSRTGQALASGHLLLEHCVEVGQDHIKMHRSKGSCYFLLRPGKNDLRQKSSKHSKQEDDLY